MSNREEIKRPTYRPSASLIIAAKSKNCGPNDYDYNLLLFKRSVRTQFTEHHYVFPGGTFEENADESMDWLHYFHEFGIPQTKLNELCLGGNKRPHPLLTVGRHFSRDISLRITAIRETFEEVGVLLCKERDSIASSYSYAHYREDFDRVHWQQVVHNDAKQFLKLCQHLKVVPDLWALSEWSVWRSPATAIKKFDTVFYFAALECEPNVLLESSEAELYLWDTPAAYLNYFGNSKIWVAPILAYELNRLSHAHSWNQLAEFSKKRNNKGSTLLWPVFYRCRDGLVATLPGDDSYPVDANKFLETVELEYTVKEFRQCAQQLHRYILIDMHNLCIDYNLSEFDGHLTPSQGYSISSKL